MPEQVQDFYPTPSTISTCMYYTGVDPRTMKPVYVPKNPHEKALQRALIQYRNPENYDLVAEALKKAGRTDLIGFEKNCLIRPRRLKKEQPVKTGRPKQKKKDHTECNRKRRQKRGVEDENCSDHRGILRYGAGVCPPDSAFLYEPG